MSGALIEIDRLGIVLHGVSAEIAEAAVGGLEAALRRRLGAVGIAGSRDVPALRVDALDLPPGIDAAALRDLIADRLVQSLADTETEPQDEEGA